METKTLLVFIIQTIDDLACPTWSASVIVDAGKRQCDEIEDSLASYAESIGLDSAQKYKDAIINVMDASGVKWRFADKDITGCSTLRTIIV